MEHHKRFACVKYMGWFENNRQIKVRQSFGAVKIGNKTGVILEIL